MLHMAQPYFGRYFRIPEDTTKADLEAVLRDLVKNERVSMKEVDQILNGLRAMAGERARFASRVELFVEQTEQTKQTELLTKLEAQYPTMKATLESYKISTKDMPAWEQVRKGLTPEVFDKALKLAEPTLLLVPPTTLQSKVEAINPAKDQNDTYTYTYELENNDLWNGGKKKIENKWRVAIVEGVQEVAQDAKIYDDKKTNYEMIKAWVKKYEEQGLDVMNDADAYLILIMKGLAEGKPVDLKTFTVLNGKNLTESSRVAWGGWRGVNVRLGRKEVDPDFSFSYDFLRLRGLVWVDVPQVYPFNF